MRPYFSIQVPFLYQNLKKAYIKFKYQIFFNIKLHLIFITFVSPMALKHTMKWFQEHCLRNHIFFENVSKIVFASLKPLTSELFFEIIFTKLWAYHIFKSFKALFFSISLKLPQDISRLREEKKLLSECGELGNCELKK